MKKAKPASVVSEPSPPESPRPDPQGTILSAIEIALNDCNMDQLWHWGMMPAKVPGHPFMPADLPTGPIAPWASYSEVPASKWSVTGALTGYWLAPGERRSVREVEMFRATVESFDEIRAIIASTPIECTVRLSGKDEAFFGEAWTLTFPSIPIIKDDLAFDHPLTGLNDRFLRKSDPAALAIQANQRAATLRARKSAGGWRSLDEPLDRLYAEQAEAEAERLVAIGSQRIVEGAGEKLVPLNDAEFSLANTLENPDMIGVAAASDRLQLARGADVLHLAIDAAETAGAANSLEKMLCHQLAALHRGAMKMTQQGLTNGTPNVEATRALGTAARMMLTFQSGMETLQKIKNRGKQTVVVKHVQVVQVQDGGQAVVAGKVKGQTTKKWKTRRGAGAGIRKGGGE